MSATLGDYVEWLGQGEIREIERLAGFLGPLRVQHINSTAEGGGVAEILHRLIPLKKEVGLHPQWTVIEGEQAFFDATKAFHNALHGRRTEISREAFHVFRETGKKNLNKVQRDADVVVIHDPQPLPLVEARDQTRARWVWRCHIDLSEADPRVWGFLRGFVERFDAAIFHLPEYTQHVGIDQYLLMPAIDPLSEKNRDLPSGEVQKVLERFSVDPERPILLQVSRFDYLKDPLGVLEAYRKVKRWADCQLVLAGGGASDDPEGERVYREVLSRVDDADVHVLQLPPDSHREINALQRAATIVIQKSIKEGFGLVVTEAMWKGKPVIGGNVGGIRRQVLHGVTGFLVNTVEGAAFRIRQLLSDPVLRQRMGEQARELVRSRFLLPHYLRNWLLVLLALRNPGRGVFRLGLPAD
ncbi:MAG: glycosyltransferase [Acidobacteria bacterium]|nr:glycosyltransferase [Acidobacteriota bacterium]